MADFQPVNIADIYAKADAERANQQNMQISGNIINVVRMLSISLMLLDNTQCN